MDGEDNIEWFKESLLHSSSLLGGSEGLPLDRDGIMSDTA